MKKFIFLIIIQICYFNLTTSQLFTTYTAVNTGTNELLDNHIFHIGFKQNGAIVFGTEHGLSIFYNEEWSNIGLSLNCFDMDAEDNIWIGTRQGKAVMYDGSALTEYQIASPSACDGSCPVISSHVDKKGIIWFGTLQGLKTFNGISWTEISGNPDYVTSMCDGLNDDIWIGSASGVGYFNGTNWIVYNKSDGLTDDFINTICLNTNGDIWAGTGAGISVFNGTEWSNITYANGLLDNNVSCINVDADDRVWVASDSGISILDGSQWSYITSLGDLDFSKIKSISWDSKNITWIGTYGEGVFKYDSVNLDNIIKGDGLSSDYVNDIHIDNTGKIWFASSFGFPSTYFESDWNSFYRLSDNAPNCGYTVTQNKLNGDIWFGTFASIVAKYNGIDWTWYDLNLYTEYCAGIYALYVDTDGNVWAGTAGGGVCEYDGINWKNYTVFHGLADNQIYSINQDSEGNMLFGTWNGLTIYNGNNWITYSKANGLAGNRVYDILVESDTLIWLGTNEGLSKFNGHSFENFYQQDGLFNNEVKSLAKDTQGNLWIGCYELFETGGITRFDGKTWISYSVKDGLASEWLEDIAIDDSSYIWIATHGGVSVLNPNFITDIKKITTLPSDDVIVYPNPTTDNVIIQTSDSEYGNTFYQIYSVTGNWLTKRIRFSNTINLVDLSVYPKGIYIIIINSNRFNSILKVVKQ